MDGWMDGKPKPGPKPEPSFNGTRFLCCARSVDSRARSWLPGLWALVALMALGDLYAIVELGSRSFVILTLMMARIFPSFLPSPFLPSSPFLSLAFLSEISV